jgi:hypothetical protein
MQRLFPEDKSDTAGSKSTTPDEAVSKVDSISLGADSPLLSEHAEEKGFQQLNQRVEDFKRRCDAEVALVLEDVKALFKQFGAPLSPLAASRERVTQALDAREKQLLSAFYPFYCNAKETKWADVSRLDVFLKAEIYADLTALLFDGGELKSFDYAKERAGTQAIVERLSGSLLALQALRKDVLFYQAYPDLRVPSYQPPTPK